MRATASEIALRRVLAWLHWNDQQITADIEQQVMQAMASTMAAGATDLFGGCLQRMGCHTELPLEMPALKIMAPPLQRGSISYGDY